MRNVFSAFAIWLVIALAISVYSKTPLQASLNVFLFFAGMCISYHLYTILFSGFNPSMYMMIWYGFTLISPILAFVCWYGKGKTKISLVIDVLVSAIMVLTCFSVGFLYIDFSSVINTAIFVISAIILYSKPKNTAISLIGGVVLALGIKLFI